jgi:SnoaL-like domain
MKQASRAKFDVALSVAQPLRLRFGSVAPRKGTSSSGWHGIRLIIEGGKFDMDDHEVQAALDRHWAASDANDLEAEHDIYREDAVLEYPQSGERIRGQWKIQSSRAAQPNRKRFTVRRIIGAGDLWVTEFVLTYDGRPSYTVSIMEFVGGKVARETQYFGDPFDPGPSRTQWVERMP